MLYTINDKSLIDDIRENYEAYIGEKIVPEDGEEASVNAPYTGIMQDVYTHTYDIVNAAATKMGIDVHKEDFKDTYDKMEHPLDKQVIETLTHIIGEKEELYYSSAKALDKLWSMLLRKSIMCLRYFDTREPFMFDSSKNAVAYGIEQLEEYHDKYTQFEGLLYGASEYYRDHIFHAVRTWLIGIFCLLHDSENPFINKIQIDGVAEEEPFVNKINFFEKLSIWTISALCHDLGYPLEKSQQVLEKTQNMMKEFVPNPMVLSNFAFTGVQDNINEYIVKFMSTKMKEVTDKNSAVKKDEKEYYGRIQPKYYLKYTKSLEKNKHGIISAVIIYKMLLYFLESDFNLNDDYIYNLEDARQFYIRREILRSISSHTCSDIYNIKNTTFSSLLFICDEMQEWGRKSWNDLYTNVNPNSVELSIEKFDSETIEYSETIKMDNIKEDEIIIDTIMRLYIRQFEGYQLIFRDGQYTNSRAFNMKKTIKLVAAKNGSKNNQITITFKLLAKSKNEFEINITDSKVTQDAIEQAFRKKLKTETLPDVIKFIAKEKTPKKRS
ncbi:MAG: hypothetical protein IKK03_11835 [Lachnospiraceae bacterium]|nr:hypothetical protein [Lachnospiraceae bacterium]